jgi:YfiH family protein
MILHNDPFLSIFFGDQQDALTVDQLKKFHYKQSVWRQESVRLFKRAMNIHNLVLVKQVHGYDGVCVNTIQDSLYDALRCEADYIITPLRSIGIGVSTADCLPIVLYDSYNHITSIVHAGWRGSSEHIVQHALEKMKQRYNTRSQYVSAYFGPSAKVCCYKVSDDFIHYIDKKFHQDVFLRHEGALYFNVPLYNVLQLERMGIKKTRIHTEYNVCTICNISFCSHRRQAGNAARQLSIVCLK